MSSHTPAHAAQLRQHAEHFEEALFAMAELNQRHNPFITDGQIIIACTHLIGTLLGAQSLPDAAKEKLALSAYKSIQEAAGLLKAQEKLNG